MAKRLQHRGGTTSQHSTFTGAVREVTVDTDKNTLVVHDGATAGGHPLATATNFTSTGIDDNATSTAITIDSSENVGIGTASPVYNLDILGQTGSLARLRIKNDGTLASDSSVLQLQIGGTTAESLIYFANPSDANVGQIRYDHASDYLSITTNASEAMRIDSSGNVGIGTSSPSEKLDLGTAHNQNAKFGNRTYLGVGRSDAGTILGHTVKADTSASSGSSPMVVTETNSGGGAPSAIRMQSGNIQFHTASSGTAGATFDSERMRIYETGAVLLGTTTVGSAGAGDLSVNGGIFLGGTGTANKLDDYEEGTWTPVIQGGTTAGTYTSINTSALYRKIGDQVTVQFQCFNITQTSAGTGNFEVSGLPFTAKGDVSMRYVGTVGVDNISYPSGSYLISSVPSGGTFVEFYENTSGTGDTKLQITDINSGTSDLYFNITYFTS